MIDPRRRRILGTVLIALVWAAPSVLVAGQTDAGAVVVNGRRTFPIGWYGLSWYYSSGAAKTLPLTESSQHGFGYVMPYSPFDYATSQEVLDYLNTAQAVGVKVMIDTHPNPVYKITSIVNLVKNHPALYGYYVDDEPELRGISASDVATRYRAIRNADPNPEHPVLLTLSESPADHLDYLAAADVIGQELYTAGQIASIDRDIAAVRAAGKGYIAIPRMYQAKSSYALAVPSAEEFKYLVFNPIAKGAGGIMPFIFEGYTGDGYPVPPAGFRDTGVYPVTDLVRQVVPALVEGSGGLAARLEWWDELLHGGDDLSWVMAGKPQDAVLIVVNDSKWSASNMDFTLTGLDPDVTSGLVLGENRNVRLTGGTFSDSFGPYGVHIYRFTPSAGGDRSAATEADAVVAVDQTAAMPCGPLGLFLLTLTALGCAAPMAWAADTTKTELGG